MDEEKLIYLVSGYPELYDLENPNYMNQLRKNNIWNEIGTLLGESEINFFKMSEHSYCRLCANKKKPNKLRSFLLDNHSSDSLLTMIKYVNESINRGDGLPQSVCDQCCRRLRTTRDFVYNVRDAQQTLSQIFPSSPDLDPINVYCDIQHDPIKKELIVNHTSISNDSVRENDSSGDENSYDDNSAEREKNKEQIPDIVEKVKPELNEENISTTNENVNLRKTETFQEYDEVKIEYSDIPDLLNKPTKANKKKWSKVKTKIKLEKKELNMRKITRKINKPNIVPAYNTIHNFACITDDSKDTSNVKGVLSTKKSLSLSQKKSTALKKAIALATKKLKERNESSAQNTNCSTDSSSESDNSASLPLYNNLPTKSEDVPEKTDDPNLPRWSEFFQCKRCSKKSTTVQELINHSMEEHDSCMPFKCVKCTTRVATRNNFFRHMYYRHYQNLKQCCEFCNQCFVSISETTWHKEKEHLEDKKLFECKLCGTGFDSNCELQVHLDTFIITRKGRYICDYCKVEYTIKFDLKRHIMENHQPWTDTCEVCHKKFKNKYVLLQHSLVHKANVNHVCSVCGKGFKQKSQWKTHMDMHLNVRPHSCDVCQKKFRTTSSLRTHLLSHGPKTFNCDFCSKSYKFLNGLKTHLRTHNNDKPYSCSDCDKHFYDRSNYSKHMRRMHNRDTVKTKPLFP